MYPHERSLVKAYADRPFALIGVNTDRDLEKARRAVEEEKLAWRNFWAGPEGTDGPIPKSWSVRAYPTVYVIDHDGIIRYKGHDETEPLDAAIAAAVAAAEAAAKD